MSDTWNIRTGMAIGHKKKREKGDKTGEYQECGQFAKWGGPLRADSMPADVFWPRISRNKLFHPWHIQLGLVWATINYWDTQLGTGCGCRYVCELQ